MKITRQIQLLLAIASFAGTSFASTYTWNLVGSNANTTVGTSETLSDSTGKLSLVFSGYVTKTSDVPNVAVSNVWLAPSASASLLFAKNSGGDEIGLGLNADPESGEHEIFKNSFIQVDLTSLLAQRTIQTQVLQFEIGSIQCGEGFYLWGSNTKGQPGTLLMTGTPANDDAAFNVPSFGSYNYYSISASNNNVLLDSVSVMGFSATTAAATPEPATLGLVSTAILGLALRKLTPRRKA